jgi:SAM-dependent methyltransferase
VNEAQREHWNSDEAGHWVVAQDRYDRQLEQFGDAVLAAAKIHPDDRVLDIGCGSGTTTLMAAPTAAAAVGVDISEPMLDLARRRASDAGTSNARFVLGDAQIDDLGGAFDVAISRFGVMFFDDPAAAFGNIASALAPGGRLVFVCWQGLDRNEWLLRRRWARHVLARRSRGDNASPLGRRIHRRRGDIVGNPDAPRWRWDRRRDGRLPPRDRDRQGAARRCGSRRCGGRRQRGH